jgi:hypothetical protein
MKTKNNDKKSRNSEVEELRSWKSKRRIGIGHHAYRRESTPRPPRLLDFCQEQSENVYENKAQ